MNMLEKAASLRFDRVRIVLERRPDDGLRVYSPDVRGLVLSHNDPAKVMADLLPAIDAILEGESK